MSFDKKPIILGLCKIKINDVDLGFSRGGSTFAVERVFHDIKADGDMGTDVGGTQLDEERPKLSINMLEVTKENVVKCFPGMKATTNGFEPTGEVIDNDFVKVECIAKTKEGKFVKIELPNAITKSNLNWTLNEKDEVVQPIEFEGCYESKTDLWDYKAPYKVDWLESL